MKILIAYDNNYFCAGIQRILRDSGFSILESQINNLSEKLQQNEEIGCLIIKAAYIENIPARYQGKVVSICDDQQSIPKLSYACVRESLIEQQLSPAIEAVISGGIFYSSDSNLLKFEQIFNLISLQSRNYQTAINQLSPTEQEVLNGYIVQGKGRSQVIEDLSIDENQFRSFMRRIYAVFSVTRKEDLVLKIGYANLS